MSQGNPSPLLTAASALGREGAPSRRRGDVLVATPTPDLWLSHHGVGTGPPKPHPERPEGPESQDQCLGVGFKVPASIKL